MVQEMIAFSNNAISSINDDKNPKIPKIPAQRADKPKVEDILKALRERNK